MLLELKIENFALVQDLEISFQPGFNVLTGESGAGKSLIVQSLDFVLGSKVKSARLKEDTTARVQAIFDISKLQLEELGELKENGVLEDEDENLVLTRKMNAAGRNLYYINGQAVALHMYRLISQALVDIHGQRDNQYLLETTNQRKLLDIAAGTQAVKYLDDLDHLCKSYRKLNEEIEHLRNLERDRNRRIDWILHEIQEIEAANLHIGEDDELERTKNILANAEKISNLSSSIYESLSGDRGVIDGLNHASKDLVKWAEYDPEIEKFCSLIDTALETVQEIAFSVRDRGESVEFDPGRLDSIIGRIHQIETLKRKYGPGIDDILAYLDNSRRQLTELKGTAHKLENLEAHKQAYAREWFELAERLSQLRSKTAAKLQDEIVKELKNLGMQDARFTIDITSPEGDFSRVSEQKKIEITPHGFDRIEYTMSFNPGMPMRPLTLIASGGELSRVMLALKNIFARFKNFSSLVLDEIDTGLGGVTAEIVGEKLREIARHRQVICITHLPVIAAMADAHFHIRKTVEEGAARTTLTPITGKERVEEVVRMIAGERAPEETRQVVEKMLKGSH